MTLQIKELEKQVHHHQDQSADLKTRLAATSGSEKGLHDAKVELDGARDEVKGLEIQVETMKSSLAHQKDLVVQLNSQISSLNEDIATKDEQLVCCIHAVLFCFNQINPVDGSGNQSFYSGTVKSYFRKKDCGFASRDSGCKCCSGGCFQTPTTTSCTCQDRVQQQHHEYICP